MGAFPSYIVYFLGLFFSNGHNWAEQRRFALHTLRDLGFGKSKMEEVIEEQVEYFCKQILEKSNGQPIDISGKFNIAVVNALWTLLTSEQMTYDDPIPKRINQAIAKLEASAGSPLALVAFTRWGIGCFH